LPFFLRLQRIRKQKSKGGQQRAEAAREPKCSPSGLPKIGKTCVTGEAPKKGEKVVRNEKKAIPLTI